MQMAIFNGFWTTGWKFVGEQAIWRVSNCLLRVLADDRGDKFLKEGTPARQNLPSTIKVTSRVSQCDVHEDTMHTPDCSLIAITRTPKRRTWPQPRGPHPASSQRGTFYKTAGLHSSKISMSWKTGGAAPDWRRLNTHGEQTRWVIQTGFWVRKEPRNWMVTVY